MKYYKVIPVKRKLNALHYASERELNTGQLVIIDIKGRKTMGVVYGKGKRVKGIKSVTKVLNVRFKYSVDLIDMLSDYYYLKKGEVAGYVLSGVKELKIFNRQEKGIKKLPPLRITQKARKVIDEIEKANKVVLISTFPDISIMVNLILNTQGKVALIVPSAFHVDKYFNIFNKFIFTQKYNAGVYYKEKNILLVGTRYLALAPYDFKLYIVVNEEFPSMYEANREMHFRVADVIMNRVEKFENSSVVFFSTLPSFYLYYYVEKGLLKLLNLDYKAPHISFPVYKNEKDILGPIRNAIKKGYKKIYVMSGIKGDIHFIICKDCGYIPRCKKCSAVLELDTNKNMLICKRCKYEQEAFDRCPRCGGERFAYQSIGTEGIRTLLKGAFKDISIFSEKSIKEFEKKGGILVGTEGSLLGDLNKVDSIIIVGWDARLQADDLDNRFYLYLFVHLSYILARSVSVLMKNRDMLDILRNTSYFKFIKEELDLRRELLFPPYYRMATVETREELNSNEHIFVSDADTKNGKYVYTVRFLKKLSPTSVFKEITGNLKHIRKVELKF